MEYKPKYNPADNAEVERISKDMSKPELEEYYTKDRNKRYTPCGEGWGIAFAILIAISMLVGIGIVTGIGIATDKVEDQMAEISIEVCPFLGQGYTSDQVLESSYDETRIVCDQTNSYRSGH